MWRPTSYEQVEQAIGVVAESPDLDFKRDLPNSKEFAKDLAAMTIRGGLLVIGVDETDGLASDVKRVPLANARERLQQIVDSAIRPVPHVEFDVLRKDPSDAEGVIVVFVPPSPLAPHYANERFPARSDTTTRYLSEPEIATLYEQRRALSEPQATHELFDAFVAPEGGLAQQESSSGVGILRIWIAPPHAARHPRGAWLRSELYEAGRRMTVRLAELDVHPRPAACDWLSTWRPRGTIGWQAGTASRDHQELLDHKMFACTYTYPSAFSFQATTGVIVGEGQGNERITYEHIWVAEALAALNLAGQFFAHLPGVGLVDCQLSLAGLANSVPYSFTGGVPRYALGETVTDDNYREGGQFSAYELERNPRPATRLLFDRFLAAIMPEGIDVVGEVAGREPR